MSAADKEDTRLWAEKEHTARIAAGVKERARVAVAATAGGSSSGRGAREVTRVNPERAGEGGTPTPLPKPRAK